MMCLLTAFPACLSAGDVAANLLPNPGFETGATAPAGWSGAGPALGWVSPGVDSGHAVVARGDGKNSHAWQTEPISLTPGGLYHLQFMARRDTNTSGGLIISGIDRVNHDFVSSTEWLPFGFTFIVPHDMVKSWVRLGQWEVNGAIYFDNATLRPVQAVHEPYQDDFCLGEGESVFNGMYRFHANFGWIGANYHRPLVVNHCSFNSDRWCFSKGAEVIYRHSLPVIQTNASLRVAFNYYVAGSLQIEASQDGKAWLPMGVLDGKHREGTNAVPAALFPAREIYIRLSTADENANFQVNSYDYEAALGAPVGDKMGNTHFLEVLRDSGGLDAALSKVIGESERDSGQSLEFTVSNRSVKDNHITVCVSVDGTACGTPREIALPAGSAGKSAVPVGFATVTPGKHEVTATFKDSGGAVLFEGRTEFNTPLLADARAGYFAGGNDALGLWWCEGAWKIGRFKSWPTAAGTARPVTVSAARGESEPFQLILHPAKPGLKVTGVFAGDFVDKNGKTPAVAATIERVAYVRVTRPTDGASLSGWYPDPLPALELPLELASGENCPLWITLKVGRDAAPGDYEGRVKLETTAGVLTVPVKLHVYHFEIPREPHLRTALGMGAGDINRFHHLQNRADQELVYDKYLTNFVEHRISPYSFFDYAGMDIRFEGEGTNKHAHVDFTQFDKAAEKWLDREKLTGFVLPLKGMGGGTFQSRSLGVLEGFTEGSPEHARLFKDYLGQIESHLTARGWMSKAYAYWFDEPDTKDYEFVAAGNQRIKAACPGLKRMLTKQPSPTLEGQVDIWCALTPEWTPEKVRARREAREEVWWYICCGPTAPYLTEFIDHPGSELRLWPWQSWQYGVQGLLIWSTTYWTSDCAYPGKNQNPWVDPMSYVSGYDFQPGYVAYWGNGDGRFLYPPQSAFASGTPCLDGPVNSLRWENLRDGMEDYEYFWLLDQAIQQAKARKIDAKQIEEAVALLTIPLEISRDTTHFTTDARLLAEHRDRVARMIETLQAP
jgi:hypothetical protein